MHAAAAYGHADLLKKLCSVYNGDINVLDNDATLRCTTWRTWPLPG